jgi:DNA-binding transcriptional regulator YdaS (Cro superfamily)
MGKTTTLNWALIDEAGEKLGITSVARKKWRRRGIPPKWWLPIERATEGEVELEQLDAFNRERLACSM